MDHSKFKETENKYIELKSSLDAGTITSEDLKVKLKKMMIRDDDGNYWMIGSNTGKWYIYNGSDWKEKDPYDEVDLAKTQNFSNLESETVVVHHEEEQQNEEIVLEQKEQDIVFESEDKESKSFETIEVVAEEQKIEISEEKPAEENPEEVSTESVENEHKEENLKNPTEPEAEPVEQHNQEKENPEEEPISEEKPRKEDIFN